LNDSIILENVMEGIIKAQSEFLNGQREKVWPSGPSGFVDKAVRFNVPPASVIISVTAGPNATAILNGRSICTDTLRALGDSQFMFFSVEGDLE
jgi:hypothetical protein